MRRATKNGVRLTMSMLLLVALTAACSGDSGSDRAGEPSEEAVGSRADGENSESPDERVPLAIEAFEGTDEEFYVVPDPLPEGDPGDLLRVQALGTAEGRVTSRVMYLSNDASGRPRAVTGIVTHPEAAPPEAGWPVISTAHGTTGVAGQCAPSRLGTAAPSWGVEGVHVETDYVGMGPVGELHPYLSKQSEGNAVINAVTAARGIPAANAGTRWISIGHSQGGHGALSAHELAAARAPELELVATVSLAPAAMMDKVYGGIDPIVTSILTMMSVYSGATEHPDIDPADYFTPEALTAAEVFRSGCLDEVTEALIPVAIGGAFVADPRTTEPAASLVRENDVGSVAVDGVPVLLASGTVDDRVVIDRVKDLFARMCGAGQVTEFHVIEGATHGSVIPLTADLVTGWINARLAGQPPVDDCATG